MKNKTLLLITIITSLLVSSCGSYKIYTGTVIYDSAKQNEIVKSDELGKYLSSKAKIKFVLRTPPNFSSMPEEEQRKMNLIFAQIEKDLILRGHIVKDQTLLDKLLNNHSYSLSEIADIIDTDIVLEVLDVQFDITNHIKNFKIKESGINTTFDNWKNINYVDCRISMMECRITLVDEGNIGGIFKFYISGCDNGSDFYIKFFEKYNGEPNLEKDAFVGWNYGNVSFKSLTNSYDMNYNSKKKALNRLVNALLEELLPTN
jgi:hypothetical protein